jgi:hypothetical protein
MNRTAAAGALARLAAARTVWLNEAIDVIATHRFVDAAWVEGSLGRGDADALSDIDLVVAVGGAVPPAVFADPVSGLGLPGRLLYTRDKPKNAPAGGAFRSVCLTLAALPVLVDLYLWPAVTATMSATARLLYQRGDDRPPRSDLDFLLLLSQYPNGDTRGSDPGQPETALMLVQLAAKHLARGDHERHAAVLRQLQVRPAGTDTAILRGILADRVDANAHPHLRAAVAAAHRLIDVAEHPSGTPTRAGVSAAAGEDR